MTNTFILNGSRQLIGLITLGTSPHPKQYMYLFEEGSFRVKECIYDNDPKHPQSWKNIYDDYNKHLGRIYGQDPTHPESWEYVFDKTTNAIIGLIFSRNDADERNKKFNIV